MRAEPAFVAAQLAAEKRFGQVIGHDGRRGGRAAGDGHLQVVQFREGLRLHPAMVLTSGSFR